MKVDRFGKRKVLSTCILIAVTMLFALPAFGETLAIGLASTVTTLDPHEQSNSPNNAASRHIYDSLLYRDGSARIKPQLATDWRALDDVTWEFNLRKDVRFHDGSDFNSEDVVASLLRARDKPSQAFAAYTRNIADVIAKGPYTVILKTKRSDPLILNSLSRLRIISADHVKKSAADFDKGEAAIGTGPFVLVSYTPGDEIVLKANENYFLGASNWKKLTLRMIPDKGARVAALLAGDLDLIESLPSEVFDRVENTKGFKVISGQSTRLVYLAMDVARDQSPFIKKADGSPLDKNPLKDQRVRKALLMSIDRAAIVSRIMRGNATIAHQFVDQGYFGHSDKVEKVPYDPEGAKHLLAEAGWGQGFQMTIHGPSGRYENDSQVLQAVGQMFARIGIETSVEVMPWSMYSGKYPNQAFSLFLASWGVNTGEVSNPALAVVAGKNPEMGTGRYNGGGVDDETINTLLKKATATLDEAKREELLRQVSVETFNNRYILPLHYENTAYGLREGIAYKPRGDKYTLSYEIKAVQ